jgi:hypothetical protein
MRPEATSVSWRRSRLSLTLLLTLLLTSPLYCTTDSCQVSTSYSTTDFTTDFTTLLVQLTVLLISGSLHIDMATGCRGLVVKTGFTDDFTTTYNT